MQSPRHCQSPLGDVQMPQRWWQEAEVAVAEEAPQGWWAAQMPQRWRQEAEVAVAEEAP